MFESHIITVPDWLCVTVTVLLGDILLLAFEKILVLFSGHRKTASLQLHKFFTTAQSVHNCTLKNPAFGVVSYCQMAVFTVIIFISQLVFAYLMATITACLTNADAARARFSEKLTLAKLYMTHEGLDMSLRKRVIDYYNYLWQRTKGVEPQQLFLSLPRSIWGSVSYCLYRHLIRLIDDQITALPLGVEGRALVQK